MNSTTNVKSVNIMAVLATIQAENSCSAATIAAATGLTTMTVGKLLAVLCESGVCMATGAQDAPVGRKASLYTINPDYGVLLGLRLGRNSLHLTLQNFIKKELESASFPCDPADIMHTIETLRAQIVNTKKRWGARLLGVGVSLPGRATRDGVIVEIPEFPAWNGISLPDRLVKGTEIPLYIDNDTNALALAVKWRNPAEKKQSFVYLNADEGLGAGIITNGRVFYGSHARGCEIGHITMDPQGPLCRCGRKGCLQAYISDQSAQQNPQRAALYIGIAAANTAKLFDPEQIYLQSAFLSAHPELLKIVKETCPAPFTLITDQELIASAPASIAYERLFSGEILRRLSI